MENSNKSKKITSFDDITRCPKCNLICLLTLIKENNKYYINYCCNNEHEGKKELEDYLNKTYKLYSISKQLCNDCGISQKDKNGEFMYCSNCNKFICYDCFKKHKKHNLFSIDKYDSLCKKHFYLYSSYCNNCKINLCPYCINEHKNHDIIYLTELKYSNDSKNNLKNRINKLEKTIDDLKNKKEEIISLFDKLKEQIELEINFMNLLLNTYEYHETKKNLNYYVYKNLKTCKQEFDKNKIDFSIFFNNLNKEIENLKKLFDVNNNLIKPKIIKQQDNSNDKISQNINNNIQTKKFGKTTIHENNNFLQNILQKESDSNEISDNIIQKKKTYEKEKIIKNNYDFDNKPIIEEKINHPMTHEENNETQDKIIKNENINENNKINKNENLNENKNINENNKINTNERRGKSYDKINVDNLDKIYTFDCEFKNNGIYEFDKLNIIEPNISFKIKNTGNINWKENEILIKTNKKSQYHFHRFFLSPLNKGESQKIKLTIPSIKEIKDDNLNIILNLYVNNIKLKKEIKFNVTIIQEIDTLKIFEFRNIFDLNENDFPNEKILKALLKNKFDYEKTFNSLFN